MAARIERSQDDEKSDTRYAHAEPVPLAQWRPETPISRLAAAMLGHAIRDLISEDPVWSLDAERWLFDPEAEAAFTCEQATAAVGLDLDATRRQLRQLQVNRSCWPAVRRTLDGLFHSGLIYMTTSGSSGTFPPQEISRCVDNSLDNGKGVSYLKGMEETTMAAEKRACEIEDATCLSQSYCMRPGQHVSPAEWTQAAVEARKRAAFESDRRVKDARKAYKAAIRMLPRRNPSPEQKAAERAAWEACSAVLAHVRSSLDQRERDGEFNP